MPLTVSDHPGVIAPPPLIFVAVLALGVAIDHVAGWRLGAVPALRYGLGIGLVAVSAVFLVAALGLFRRARTRPEPWQPTTAIVSTGIYGLTRNPMYVGMSFAYAGAVLITDSLTALFLLPVVLFAIHYGVIKREERYLENKFGSDYLSYKGRVRRWL